ncbi:carboxypeptidase-like regulatory domain-containing protein [uncultured Prevotella sp.]|uniref:TonB-dependent receptor n=1 Tax=uncultured Prevotella sp. TaxID=159272 RepID=UPI0025D08F88|nr:carboxypeptidase-like regulatory domain-containing protein [uncultured Prevotella sp.]
MAQSFTLKGKVIDDEGNALELATVSCLEQGAVTMTNLKGEFQLTLHTADSVVVKFSMVGYQERKRVLRNPRTTQTIQIELHSKNELGGVTVTQRRRQTDQMEHLDIKDIKGVPSTTGNAVEELIQQQAGVSTHNELSSQYNVRGGSFDENSVYINNVEVYRPLLIRSGQQEGLSVINADMVENVSFSSGGFSAKYGDKMSSALDITYRRPESFEASAMASLLGGSAYVGTSNKKYSMSHGLRYKTNRYLLGSLETTGEYRPNQLDYQTYITYEPNRRWTLELLGNISENHYNFKPKDRETSFGTMKDVKSFKVYFDGQEKDIFRTLFATAAITRHISDSTHIKLLWSAYHTKEQERYDIQGQYWLNEAESAEQLGVGTYAEHARNYLTGNVQSLKLILNRKLQQHDIEAGLTYKWEHIKEQSREYEMRDSSGYSVPHTANRLDLIYTLSSNNDMKSNRIEGYIQDIFRWHNGDTHYTLNYGVRFAHWSFNKETILSPRVSLAIVPSYNQDLTYRFATGLYYQAPFYKELRDTTTVAGITVATLNKDIKSQRSLQFIAAMDYRFKMNERPYKFTAETYYKALSNLIPYNVQNVKVTYYGQNLCTGYTAGLDLKLYGEFVPGTDSWISFSLMSTKQKMNGQWIPMPTDQRYALNLHFTDYFPGTERWKMTLRLSYADGLPFGAPHRGLDSQSFRAPAYKRADIGMSYLALHNFKAIKNIWLGVDCLNLFGISNVNSYYWVTDVSNRQWAVPNYLTGRQINGKIIVEL